MANQVTRLQRVKVCKFKFKFVEEFSQCFCENVSVCGSLTAAPNENLQQAAHLWQYLKMKSRQPVVGQYKYKPET